MKPGKRPSGRVGSLSVREAAYIYHSNADYTLEDVAKIAGVTRSPLHYAFVYYGVPRKASRSHPRKIRLADFVRGRKSGWSKGELARNLGVNIRSLIRAQARLGFDWPERDRPEWGRKRR